MHVFSSLKTIQWFYVFLCAGLVLFMGMQEATSKALKMDVIPSGFGVSAHGLGKDFAELEDVYKAGFRIVRRDLTWDWIEKSENVYSWGDHDVFAQKMKKLGMRPLFILDYSNPLYAPKVAFKKNDNTMGEKVAAPATKESIEAFAKFAVAAAEHFKEYDPIWEIWNEPEHAGFWPPKPDPSAYATLANMTCSAIRKVDPDATIIAPAAAKKPTMTQPNPPLLAKIMERGLLRCVDGVSIHPYIWFNKLDGDTGVTWELLREMMAKYVPKEYMPAVVNSEWGLSTVSKKMSEQQQASYLVRMMLLNASYDVPVSIWYDWKDDGEDPDENEHHFGVMYHNGTDPKPAWHAMRYMTDELNGYKFKCRADHQSNGASVLVFDKEGSAEWRLALWNSEKEGRGELYLPKTVSSLKMTSMLGDAVVYSGKQTQIDFALSHEPVFVRLLMSAEDKNKYCDKNERRKF